MSVKTVKLLEQNSSKKAVHSKILDDLERTLMVGKSAKALRLITLPGASCNFERGLLESDTRSAKTTRNIFCLESDPKVFPETQQSIEELQKDYPQVQLQLNNCTDCELMTPTNTHAKVNLPRQYARMKDGFDMIWLDYMSPWCSGVESGVTHVARDINVFERAWRSDRPGLLYFTLALGRERAPSIKVLKTSIVEMSVSKPSDPVYDFRARGFAAFLNYQTKMHDAHCVPIRAHFYRERAKRRAMYLMGFHVYPGREDSIHTARAIEALPLDINYAKQ